MTGTGPTPDPRPELFGVGGSLRQRRPDVATTPSKETVPLLQSGTGAFSLDGGPWDQREDVGAGPHRRALLMGTVNRVWVESEASIVSDLLNRSSAIF